MTSTIRSDSSHSADMLQSRLNAKRQIEKALKEKFDYPTRDELRKRIPSTITKYDFDSALKGLESEAKIMIDERDGRIVWIAPENEEKAEKNFVPLD